MVSTASQEADITPILKSRPRDFLVYESLALPLVSDPAAPFRYLRLRKSGYTTFEAVEAVSTAFGIPRLDVGYAGLKDEDGVTEQYVSVPSPGPGGAFSSAEADPERFVELAPVGFGRTPLSIGRLSGNLFRIVVRNLTESAAKAVDSLGGRSNLFFVNYYDTQRFGVPTGPKQTHLLGGALLAGDHDAALDLLRASDSPEAPAALAHTGAAADFFAALDPRVRSFYLCAHSSALWNHELKARLAATTAPSALVHRDGIPYLFPTKRADVLGLLRQSPELDYLKYRWTGGEMRRSVSARPTVIQAHISVDGVRLDDEVRPGTWQCDLSFFLPSGCYATMAVSQFLHGVAAAEAAPVLGEASGDAG